MKVYFFPIFLLLVSQGFAQKVKKDLPLGMDYQSCAATVLQPPFDMNGKPVIIDKVKMMKTVKSPIYIKVIDPPKNGDIIRYRWLTDGWRKLPNKDDQKCFIINVSNHPNVYIDVQSNSHSLMMESSQMNPGDQEATNWCRIINVAVPPAGNNPSYNIKFIIWQVKTESRIIKN